MIELAASILAADFAHLADEIAASERGGATILHVDIMDGHFGFPTHYFPLQYLTVPNITIGPPVVTSLRKAVPRERSFFDCHMMVSNPGQWVDVFAEAGAGPSPPLSPLQLPPHTIADI